MANQWKVVNATAIFRKGRKSATSNYCSVSLSSVVGKMLGPIITRIIRGHSEKYDLIHDSQYDFTNFTNQLSFYTKVIESADREEDYDVL